MWQSMSRLEFSTQTKTSIFYFRIQDKVGETIELFNGQNTKEDHKDETDDRKEDKIINNQDNPVHNHRDEQDLCSDNDPDLDGG